VVVFVFVCAVGTGNEVLWGFFSLTKSYVAHYFASIFPSFLLLCVFLLGNSSLEKHQNGSSTLFLFSMD